jgi:ketosteroid isomerase-like protein
MTTAEPASVVVRYVEAVRDVIIGVFAVRDGKTTSVREYTDTQHVEHVLFGQR